MLCPFCGKNAEVFDDSSASCEDPECLIKNIGRFGTSFTMGQCESGIKGYKKMRPCVLIQVIELPDLGIPARFIRS